MRPLQQGDLDGLCGLYALINTARMLCPEIDEISAQRLFWHLVTALDETGEAGSVAKALRFGTDITTLSLLLEALRDQVRQEIGIRLAAEPIKLEGKRWSLTRLWTTLRGHLDEGAVAIIGLSGKLEHWTVGYRMTNTTMRLLDSDGRLILIRSRCGLGRKTLHRLAAREIIVVKRVELDL